MSFDLSEYQHINLGANASVGPALDRSLAISRFNEAARKGAPVSVSEMPAVIYPQIHVLSADKATRNKTRYPTQAHKGSRKERTGQHSFTKPYPIPMIRDHQAAPGECGGEASPVYGRFIDAKLVKNVESGQGHVAGLTEVPHPEAIFEIMSGLWLTGSLGSSVHLAQCSICSEAFNSPGAMSDHEHRRGGHYRPKKASEIRAQSVSRESEVDAVIEYIQCDSKERGAVECLTDVMSYSAREYSRVVVPSDDESIIDVVDTSSASSHFTTAPTAEASELPASALWVPMSRSSRANIGAWGERYIDLVSGQEKAASDLGLMFGHQLHEHFERLISDEDSDIAFETVSISRQAHVPYTFSGLTVESSEDCHMTDASQTEEDLTSEGIVATIPAETPSEVPTTSTETIPTEITTLATPTQEKQSVGNFCGPNNTFLVNDKAHYSAALKMVGRYKGPGNKAKIRSRILFHGKANGWDK